MTLVYVPEELWKEAGSWKETNGFHPPLYVIYKRGKAHAPVTLRLIRAAVVILEKLALEEDGQPLHKIEGFISGLKKLLLKNGAER